MHIPGYINMKTFKIPFILQIQEIMNLLMQTNTLFSIISPFSISHHRSHLKLLVSQCNFFGRRKFTGDTSSFK